MEKGRTNRLLALEGLRGVAAIIVVIFHLCIAIVPSMMGYANFPQRYAFEDNFHGSPLSVFTSGVFAVAIFYVLSGFVLSIGFFQTGNESIIRKLAAKRYLRLAIPTTVSIMFAWLLMASGLVDNHFDPNFFGALYQGLATVFTADSGIYNYNNVTRTMVFEFAGSLIVFAFCLIFGKMRYRWLMYIIMLVIVSNTWFIAFVFGLILADLYANRNKLFEKAWAWYALLAGLFLGGYSLGYVKGTIYETLQLPGFSYEQNQLFFLSIGALLLIGAILASNVLQKIFTKISKLGKYTFALYLVHLPILYSLFWIVFDWLGRTFTGIGFGVSVLISFVVYALVTALATYLFEKYVDAPSIRLSGRFANLVLGNNGSGKKIALEDRQL